MLSGLAAFQRSKEFGEVSKPNPSGHNHNCDIDQRVTRLHQQLLGSASAQLRIATHAPPARLPPFARPGISNHAQSSKTLFVKSLNRGFKSFPNLGKCQYAITQCALTLSDSSLSAALIASCVAAEMPVGGIWLSGRQCQILAANGSSLMFFAWMIPDGSSSLR